MIGFGSAGSTPRRLHRVKDRGATGRGNTQGLLHLQLDRNALSRTLSTDRPRSRDILLVELCGIADAVDPNLGTTECS